MTINSRPDFEKAALYVDASGVLTWDERREAIAAFRKYFQTGKIKYVLFDLRELTGDNDPRAEVEFGQEMVEAIAEFTDVRAAVVLSDEFLISSSVVLQFQQNRK